MKFGKIIEYNMRKIFLEKPYIKCGEETIHRPFSKISKVSISLNQYAKLYAKLRAIKKY